MILDGARNYTEPRNYKVEEHFSQDKRGALLSGFSCRSRISSCLFCAGWANALVQERKTTNMWQIRFIIHKIRKNYCKYKKLAISLQCTNKLIHYDTN